MSRLTSKIIIALVLAITIFTAAGCTPVTAAPNRHATRRRQLKHKASMSPRPAQRLCGLTPRASRKNDHDL
jgi:hypothetical protein